MPFFSETTEVCNCRKCKKEFKAYNYWEHCPNCHDGETSYGLMCHACGGRGDLESVVKDICQDCLYLELTEDDD